MTRFKTKYKITFFDIGDGSMSAVIDQWIMNLLWYGKCTPVRVNGMYDPVYIVLFQHGNIIESPISVET